MGSLDIPEVLILVGTVIYVAWALYVWTHRDAGMHK